MPAVGQKTLIIIPTYNEVENIALLLDAIETNVPGTAVLVVDDNSPDGTQAAVESKMETREHVHLLRRPGKQGLGMAYKAGFQWAFDRGFDCVLQMDADFSHPPTKLPAMIEGLKNNSVTNGSRYIPSGGVSGWGITRRVISRGGNLYARSMLGMRLNDMTGGFVGWRREVLESIDYHSVGSKGYVFQIELKYRATRKGYSILEVPIHFENRKLGKSKMSGAIFWEAAVQVFKLRSQTGSLRS
jgi:dolichol-phosphate mannosyltransferase